ncbi:MAG: chemotaxis protein CheX [Aquabacterium sp.]
MNDEAKLSSKVLVLDQAAGPAKRIKTFCDENNLIGVKTSTINVMSVLKSNVDLGAIFLSENYGGKSETSLAFAREIHNARPELPIFLRRDDSDTLADLSDSDRSLFRCAYKIDQMDRLQEAIKECLFNLSYPSVLVRGINEITQAAINGLFRDLEIDSEAPYIVRDRIIYGELFSLIPLESDWCRGYMMLQADEKPMLDIVESGKTPIAPGNASFRDINNVLGEATNMIWGAFKNRYISYDATPVGRLSQVPIIVNHMNRYISFGSEDPQLCFKYTLRDPDGQCAPLVIYQRFVFNLNWSPDKFKENEAIAEDLFESGELELF